MVPTASARSRAGVAASALLLAGALAGASCRKVSTATSRSTAVTTTSGRVGGLASDGSTLFYASAGDGLASRSSAGARPVPAEGADGGSAIGVDEQRVYYTSGFAVRSVAKAGGAPIEHAHHESDYTRGIAVDAESVYWGVEDAAGSRLGPARPAMIRKAPKAGGPAVTVATMPHLYDAGIVLDAAHVYYAAYGGVFRVPKDGSAKPALVAAAKADFTSLAVDERHVYFTLESFAVGGGDVRRAEKGGGPVEVVAAEVQPIAVAVDASGVYVLGRTQVLRIAKTGGAPVVLDTGLRVSEGRIALDAATVYWSDRRAVMKLAK